MTLLKPLTLMLTSAGCPGASTCLRHLQAIQERPVKVIGIDCEPECIGRFFADAFYPVPPVSDPTYISRVFEIAKENQVDCILVSSSLEIEIMAEHAPEFDRAGIKVLASSPEGLRIANNKKMLYEHFKQNPLVKVPDFRVVNSLSQFVQACQDMGFPERPLCFKPPVSKGSRGFRFLASAIDRVDLLMNQKPDNKIISLDEMIDIFSDRSDFPELLVMECVQGEEIDTMVLALNHEPLLITHKTRETERGGVITRGGHCERPALSEAVKAICKDIDLRYNVGIQFKGGHLIEINPRLSTFLYTADWVEPYFAVKLALGEWTPDEVIRKQREIPKNLRMIRYFDQTFYSH